MCVRVCVWRGGLVGRHLSSFVSRLSAGLVPCLTPPHVLISKCTCGKRGVGSAEVCCCCCCCCCRPSCVLPTTGKTWGMMSHISFCQLNLCYVLDREGMETVSEMLFQNNSLLCQAVRGKGLLGEDISQGFYF